jgi:TATA-box binding protein (TBP) (component of TFIID and TFIIIB)
MNTIYFTPYKVSTITCNENLGKNLNINLEILFNELVIDKQIVWAEILKENLENSKGINPKKKKNNKKNKGKKNRFDNQITIIYVFNENYKPNVKIFKNGNIQLTGIKNKDDTSIIINKIIEQIKYIYQIDNNVLFNCKFEDIERNNFIIRMINTDFKSYVIENGTQNQYLIRRKKLHKILISDTYNNKCSFQPGIYHGVKLEFFWNSMNETNNGICNCPNHCFGKGKGNGLNDCKKITVAIFESGSILITGGVCFKQIDDAYNYICSILIKHEDEIRKSIQII